MRTDIGQAFDRPSTSYSILPRPKEILRGNPGISAGRTLIAGALPRHPAGRILSPRTSFRRDGVAVPAQRHHRSGATASRFRRNGITVPARRHHRSGATASPFRRNGVNNPPRMSRGANRVANRRRLSSPFQNSPIPADAGLHPLSFGCRHGFR